MRKTFCHRLLQLGRHDQAAAYAAKHGIPWPPGGGGPPGASAGNGNQSTSADLKLKNIVPQLVTHGPAAFAGPPPEAPQELPKSAIPAPDGVLDATFEASAAGSNVPAVNPYLWPLPENFRVGNTVLVPVTGADGTREPTACVIQNLIESPSGRLIIATLPRGPLDEPLGAVRRLGDPLGAVRVGTLGLDFGSGPQGMNPPSDETPHDFKPPRDPLPREARYALIVGEFKNPLMKRIFFQDDGPERGRHETLWVTRRQLALGLASRGRTVAVTWNDDPEREGWKLWIKK